jgi:RNA polymerase sigma factor
VWGVDRLAAIIDAAKTDMEMRNAVIEKYTPFIIKTVSEVSNRYIDIKDDDDYSIGLMAFNEAIDSFNSSRGVSFLTFAKIIIQRRLIDNYRKQSKMGIEVSMQAADEAAEQLEYQTSVDKFRQQQEQQERMAEITDYSRMLNEFGISFENLVKVCPKKRDARIRSFEIARLIAADRELSDYLINCRQLPIKEIEQKTDVSRKTIERNRKYIIAAALILVGDYKFLKSYVQV